MSRCESLQDRALGVFPGGVNSPVRSLGPMRDGPLFIERAAGSRVWDADGNGMIDFVGSWGAAIHGHAFGPIVDAVTNQLALGTPSGLSAEPEIQLAELIRERVPICERIRFVNSGTEATMSAVRLARTVTERPLIVKFTGGYHGHSDGLLVRAGSGVETLGLPDSPGVSAAAASETLSLPYNDPDAVRRAFGAHGQQIAAVLIEPLAGNMGVVPPRVGFLELLRELTQESGSLLIFDEVMTGFRVSRGGATERYGVEPDLVTLGKVIGGGLPVGAYGGPRALLARVAPEGPMYQAGTMSGNALTMAAGRASLQRLDSAHYEALEHLGSTLESGLGQQLDELGIDGCVQRVGSMLTLYFGPTSVKNLDDAKGADHQRFAAYFRAMRQRGVLLPPSGYEPWFLSMAHTEADIAETLKASATSLREVTSPHNVE